MRFTAKEKKLLNEALECLKKVVPVGKIRIRWRRATDRGLRADAVLDFENLLLEQHAEIKTRITHRALGAIQLQMEHLEKPAVLVTWHVTGPMAEELRRRGIQFIDTTGSMYLKQSKPFLLVYTNGKKDLRAEEKPRPVQIFRGTKLKVLFVLLTDPEAVNLTYREIADRADVALGTVAWAFRELKQLGFIRVNKQGRRLDRRERLVDAWLEAYPNEIRPKLNPRRFTVADRNWWKKTDIAQFGVVLGGEPAAALLTGYLHPETITVYAERDYGALARKLKIRKDDEGNLLVMDKFWKDIDFIEEGVLLAPLLLVCAELLAEGGARNLETARMIREKYNV